MPLIPALASLLVIDLQTRLMPAIAGQAGIVQNVRRLVQGADLLGQAIIATEQYPTGLGPTLADILPPTVKPLPKTSFDAVATPAIANRLSSARAVVVCGAEAHVCVLQTVLSLRAAGVAVWVVADATGSRDPANHSAALTRMAAHGAEVVTTEMVLFETLRDAAHPQFRAISALVK